jgi:hypothetical protein
MKQNLSPYKLTNLTTQLVGPTSFLESNLIDYTANTINSPVGNVTQIDVYNSVTFNLTVYGYGIRINNLLHCIILVNNTNGQIISSFLED